MSIFAQVAQCDLVGRMTSGKGRGRPHRGIKIFWLLSPADAREGTEGNFTRTIGPRLALDLASEVFHLVRTRGGDP